MPYAPTVERFSFDKKEEEEEEEVEEERGSSDRGEKERAVIYTRTSRN